MAPTLNLFDRFDERLGPLAPAGPVTHTEEIGGEDTLEFGCLTAPEKGDRIVWRDPEDGSWREHVVVRTDEGEDGLARVFCEWSLCDLLGDFVDEVHIVDDGPAEALEAVLAGTRWQPGEVSGAIYASKHCIFYHTNPLAAIRRVEELWGGELEAAIEVSGGRVARRTVSMLERRGAWRGARLEYGINMAGCTRTVLEDEVFTALYGFGRGEAVLDETGAATGAYTRRLTFGRENGGVDWIGDEEARLRWGLWNADRTEKVHRFGQVVFADCNDASRLLGLTRKALAEACAPRVSYTVDALALAGGVPVGLGDDVAIVDRSRLPEWRHRARCMRRVRTFGEGPMGARYTLGALERTSWSASAEMAARVVSIGDTAEGASGAVTSYENLDGREF